MVDSAGLTVTTTAESGGVRVVRLVGELDMASGAQLSAVLEHAIRSPEVTGVVIDLTELRFIDANGLRRLIIAHRLAGSLHRSVRARHPRGEVDMLLRLTGVADLFGLPVVPSAATASTTAPAPRR